MSWPTSDWLPVRVLLGSSPASCVAAIGKRRALVDLTTLAGYLSAFAWALRLQIVYLRALLESRRAGEDRPIRRQRSGTKPDRQLNDPLRSSQRNLSRWALCRRNCGLDDLAFCRGATSRNARSRRDAMNAWRAVAVAIVTFSCCSSGPSTDVADGGPATSPPFPTDMIPGPAHGGVLGVPFVHICPTESASVPALEHRTG